MLIYARYLASTAAAALICTVANAATSSANRAPTITGQLSNGVVGKDYYFMPKATDPESDRLTFSIVNAPHWMEFRDSDGRITGQPDAAGVHPNIVVSVKDTAGNVTSLPPVTVTVTGDKAAAKSGAAAPAAQPCGTGSATLSWAPPTQNADKSKLSNLAGYRISYGVAPTKLTQSAEVPNPGATRYKIECLVPGTYYFKIRAYTSAGTESELSSVVSLVVK